MTVVNPRRRSLAPFIAIAASLFSLALLLWLEGRFAFCTCGVFRVWSGNTCSSTNSQQLFDPYSFTHVLHGFLLFWLVALIARNIKPGRQLAPPWQLSLALTLEPVGEVFENSPSVTDRYRAETAALGYPGDTNGLFSKTPHA